MQQETWITIAELANQLRMSPTSIDRLWKAGKIPQPSMLTPKMKRWSQVEINEWTKKIADKRSSYAVSKIKEH